MLRIIKIIVLIKINSNDINNEDKKKKNIENKY